MSDGASPRSSARRMDSGGAARTSSGEKRAPRSAHEIDRSAARRRGLLGFIGISGDASRLLPSKYEQADWNRHPGYRGSGNPRLTRSPLAAKIPPTTYKNREAPP